MINIKIMKDFDLISVIIPTYNRSYCIERSIRSVLNQSYKNLELIVVDDCSTDDTERVVHSIEDARLRYTKLKKNSGPSAARNAGIKLAQGSYIAFHDSDDVWHLDKLEKQMNCFAVNPDSTMVFCKFKILGENPKIIPEDNFFDTTLCEHGMLDILLRSPKIGAPTILIKKSNLKTDVFFDESLHTLEDWELSLKIAANGKISFVNEVLVDVYQSENGVNNSSSEKKFDALIFFLEEYWNFYNNKDIFTPLLKNIIFQFDALSNAKKKLSFEKLDRTIVGSKLFFEIIDELLSEKNALAEHLCNLDEHIKFLDETIERERKETAKKDEHIKFLDETIERERKETAKKDEYMKILCETIDGKCKDKTKSRENYKIKLVKACVTAFCDETLAKKILSASRKNIALYGAGEVTQVLIPLCKKSGIEIPFTIDRKPKVVDEVPSYTVEQIPDKNIPVIITAYDPEHSIKTELENVMTAEIFYLDELLDK